ncbi:TerD [Lysinibacillus phage vB_LfM_LysYB1]|nr:TerD [Lysinibacillus phage vB_LfM_LysYB1]WAB25408.1 TerD [Lysinibacillus phage vB_LfM_LysYB2]
MSLNLTKGQNINLSKEAPGLTKAIVGLGWDTNKYDGGAFDLDATAAGLNAEGKLVTDNEFVFFNNLNNPSGTISHSGDNLTGEGNGDDEQITIDLAAVPAEIQKVQFAITIYQGKERGQNFGIVENAYARVIDGATDTEIVRVDLTEDHSAHTTVIAGEFYRHNGDWKFKALDQGINPGGIEELVASYK